jgi:hypothetical protein
MKDTRSFIADEYRPTGIRFQDPRNMALIDIRQALQHCYRRQAESGPGSAFRFSLFIGSQRKHTSAIYPDPSNPGPSKSKNPRKKKDKGKQREDPLQGLLRIDESVEPPTAEPAEPVTQPNMNPTVGGPANQCNQKPFEHQTSENDLVRIDMGQMLRLKDMGYEAVGPVNGPNEGYPEYEVPTAMLQMLQSRSQTSPTPNQGQRSIEPKPAPNMIDPALLGQADQTNDPSPDKVDMPPEVSIVHPTTQLNNGQGSIVRPTTPPNANADSAPNQNHNKTPQQKLGKRVQANLSPQNNHHERGNSKKKKLTADDRAAMEAQNMVQSGSRRRKPTRRQ